MVLSCPTAIVALFIVELNSTLYQGKPFVVLHGTKRRLPEYKLNLKFRLYPHSGK